MVRLVRWWGVVGEGGGTGAGLTSENRRGMYTSSITKYTSFIHNIRLKSYLI